MLEEEDFIRFHFADWWAFEGDQGLEFIEAKFIVEVSKEVVTKTSSWDGGEGSLKG